MDIQTATEHCLDELSLAENTRRSYRNGLKRFLDYLEENKIKPTTPLEELNIEQFIYFYAWLHRSYPKSTAGTYGSASKAFFDWLVLHDIFHPDYSEAVRYQQAMRKSHRRHENRLPRWPQKDDVEKMIAAARACSEPSPRKERNIALLEFLASSGCRISEAIALNVQDLDLEDKTTIVMGKGRKERRVYFSPTAAIELRNYWSVRKAAAPGDPAFARHDRGAGRKVKRMTATSARDIVKLVARVAGIDPTKFTPHYFRHAFAIRVLSETGNLALVQDLLGHKDPGATRVYAKIYPEELRSAHQAIFK